MANNCEPSIPKINSPYLINGFLKATISYDPYYSLKNLVPICDEYGKVKLIGSGSYGQVYLALHTINKKYYAVKHMDKKKLYSLLHSLTSIQEEIEIQSKIDHPNIVKLLYVKETNSSYDLIMEYASAGSLFHYIRKFKGLNENKSFSLFMQVVNAVNFLHQNDLIHRDIKPENILMYENNVVKLCDFGWCVKLEGHQRGTFCGTTEYMSPELVNHEGYGKEIDVWSLGVLLYEMIHGYSPFRPNKPKFNEKDVMENIINHNLIFEREISDECKELIYHLLEPNIHMRYRVEDIYKSSFVKKYELMHYNIPNMNLIYKNNGNQSNIIIDINKNKENFNINNNSNNIIYQEISQPIGINNNNGNNIPNSFDDKIYSISNNNQIQEFNNIYNNYSNNNSKTRNLNNLPLNRDVYSEYINFINNNYEPIENEKINNNYFEINNSDNNNLIKDINIILENNNNSNIQRKISNENKLLLNKTTDNFYPINRENEILYIYNEQNNDILPKNQERDNKQFINFNTNQFLFLSGNNQNNIIIDKNISELNQLNNIWNNANNNTPNQINNIISSQNIQIEKPNDKKSISNKEIANNVISNYNKNNNNINNQKIDNSVNYNYYYNFNNYNNNFTNNYFNNSYNSISNQIIKKVPLSSTTSNNNNSINSININQNSNNSTINNTHIIDKNKTPSTIPTTSVKNIPDSKNKNQNIKDDKVNKNKILNKNSKISEFEIGEENYNISEKEQNEGDSSIKINIIKDSQKINNRKYLSKSDYSIFNKKTKEKDIIKNKSNNLNGKEIKMKNINNFNSIGHNSAYNSSRFINRNEELENMKKKSIQKKISAIYLNNKNSLEEVNKKATTYSNINIKENDKDKIKILDENKDNIKIHEIKIENSSISIPKNKNNDIVYPHNLNLNQIKSSSYSENKNNIIVEINNKSKSDENNKNTSTDNSNKLEMIEKINKEKKDYYNVLKEVNLNKKNNILLKKENKNSNKNFISDVLCSIFNVFDSKKDEKNELNMIKKRKNYNKNTNHVIKNNLLKQEVFNPKYADLKHRNNSFINISLSPNIKNNSNEIKEIYNNQNIKTDINKINNNDYNKIFSLKPIKSSFIKFSYNRNNNTQILNLGQKNFKNCHSADNINNKFTKLNDKIKNSLISKNNFHYTKFSEFKKEVHNNSKILKTSNSSSPNNINKNEKKKINIKNYFGNKNNILKEIPIFVKDIPISQNESKKDDYSNLGDSKIITPKKRYIFNRVNPIKLLGAFKKELTKISKKEKLLKLKRGKK